MSCRCLLLVLLVLPPGVGLAQDTIRVEIRRGGDGLTRTVVPAEPIRFGATREAILQVFCRSGIPCGNATAVIHVRGGAAVDADPLTPKDASDSIALFIVPQSVGIAAEDRELVIHLDDAVIPGIMIGKVAGGTAPTRHASLFDLLTTPCSPPEKVPSYYDASADTAYFDVTPLGAILRAPPSGRIDEDDVVMVRIRADSLLASRIVVRRSSEIRTTGGTRIAGEDVQIRTPPGFRPFAAGGTRNCQTVAQSAADFAPGKGTIEIVLRQPETLDQDIALGEISFPVNPLYSGAFALGLVRSSLTNPVFGLAFNGTDSVITEVRDPSTREDNPSEEADRTERHRLIYTVFYIPFLKRRDLEREKFILSPALEISFDDLSENAFVGASLSVVTAFFVLGGAHIGRVRGLDPRSGLELGSPFAGSSSEIPLVERWKTDLYVGVGVDLRAAVKLFKVAFGGSS